MEPLEDIVKKYNRKWPLSRTDMISLIQEMNNIISSTSVLGIEVQNLKDLIK